MNKAQVKEVMIETPADTDIFFTTAGAPDADVVMVWGHGWGQTHQSFMPLVTSLEKSAFHIVIDFPGFGQSPVPPDVWSTSDYADAVAKLIRSQTDKPVIWAGHSFGGRVGLQLAAHHPGLIKGLCLIAAAGLPRKHPLWHKLYYGARIKLFKFLKSLIPHGIVKEDWLMRTFGSADYNQAGPMRSILVKTVNEDLTETARKISCPTLLIYGENDTETPPEIGERLQTLINGSKMVHLPAQDHYSVLGEGRHQVAPLVKTFINKTLD